MPPPHRIRALRPCFQTRRAIKGSRRQLSSRHGDSKDAQLRAQGSKSASSKDRQVQSRSVGWWESLVSRASTLFSGNVPTETPGQPNSGEIAEPSPQTVPRNKKVSKAPAQHSQIRTRSTSKSPSAEGHVRPKEKNRAKYGDGEVDGDGEDPILSPRPNENVKDTIIHYLGVDVIRELQNLRDQVNLLQQSLQNGSALSPPPSNKAMPRTANDLQRKPSQKLKPLKLRPPPSGHPDLSTEGRLLNEARERMRKSRQILEKIITKLAYMSSPRVVPLTSSVRETAFIFRRHMEETFATVPRRVPQGVPGGELLNKAKDGMRKNRRIMENISTQLDHMSSPEIAPLARSVRETTSIFQRHMEETFGEGHQRAPGIKVILPKRGFRESSHEKSRSDGQPDFSAFTQDRLFHEAWVQTKRHRALLQSIRNKLAKMSSPVCGRLLYIVRGALLSVRGMWDVYHEAGLRARSAFTPDRLFNEARHHTVRYRNLLRLFRTELAMMSSPEMMASPAFRPLLYSVEKALRNVRDIWKVVGEAALRVPQVKAIAEGSIATSPYRKVELVQGTAHSSGSIVRPYGTVYSDRTPKASRLPVDDSSGRNNKIRWVSTKSSDDAATSTRHGSPKKHDARTAHSSKADLPPAGRGSRGTSQGNASDKPKPSEDTSSEALSAQSLLEELFPEASSYIQPHYTSRNPYPKLEPPKVGTLLRPDYVEPRKSARARMLESLQNRGESLTALQFVHCSTELSEEDFRRLIPKGKHIDTWIRGGEFHQVIPGRDPATLERLPFYYLIFKSPESALAYQKNASRLHKLVGLHHSASPFSAIPPPPGFLEDGEDLAKIASTYILQHPTLQLHLNIVMQPYNPSLRKLIELGGYKPIVPNITADGKKIWKVLLQIDGWEPAKEDLYHAFARHAKEIDITWPFHNNESAIHKLRDLVDVKIKFQDVSAANPRASYNSSTDSESHDALSSLILDPLEQSGSAGGKGSIGQIMMNRLYNRWIVEFEEREAARRFARVWHRRVLPSARVTWREEEVVRMVNAEFLW